MFVIECVEIGIYSLQIMISDVNILQGKGDSS